MMENHSYEEVIGNPAAPNINALATQYGLATNDWGVTHPSEPNYVASTAGSFFGIQDDNPYWTHQVAEPNLGSQLEAAGLSWKTYQQSLPSVGFTGNNYPAGVVPGATAKLYASKHNPFVNYLALYGPVPTTSSDGEFPSNFTPNAAQQTELNKMVPDTQLATDLANGTVPNLSYILPDQCHDMHGTTGCPTDATLIPEGDQYVSATVQAIMASKTWQEGNNAIVITWDENDFSPTNGFPGIASDGGHVATIVIANHGPRGVQYGGPANHYALTLTNAPLN
jgi:Phosphoesterase family